MTNVQSVSPIEEHERQGQEMERQACKCGLCGMEMEEEAKAKNALSGRVDKVKRVRNLVQQDYLVLTDLAVKEIEGGCVLFQM